MSIMASNEFFPQRPESHPLIYAYSDNNPQYQGLLKVSYTEKDVEKRVAQQYPAFTDHDVHLVLRQKSINGVGDG